MKNVIIIISVLFSFSLYAQNEVDALRFSSSVYGGTARGVSMGGAFGSLGGDLSSISYNPAGLGVYRSSEFNFTPSFYYNTTTSNYNGNSMYDFKQSVNINNIGGVISSVYGKNSDEWISTSFAFGYNRTNNYNSYTLIEGVNNESSVTDFFARKADGSSSDNLNGFNTALAWDAYLINHNYDDTNNFSYESVMANYGQVQNLSKSSSGGAGEYFVAIGGNYGHKLYIGGSFALTSVNYNESRVLEENDVDDVIDNFESLKYTQILNTSGNGYNLKFGAIYRPINWIRIGASIHSPTIYKLKEQYSTSVSSVFSINTMSGTFSSGENDYNYTLSTPLKAIGSISFIIKKRALISLDYEMIDYSQARLRASDYGFGEENNTIQTAYGAANNIRVGAEYRLGSVSLRGGYSLYGSPYRTNQVNYGSLELASYSGGIGFKNNDSYIDIAFVYSEYSEKYYLYDPSIVAINGADISSVTSKLLVTIGTKF